MKEENRLESKFYFGLFKITTNLSTDEVKARISDVTSRKTSFVSIIKSEVYENRDKYMYSGYLNDDFFYLFNIDCSHKFHTVAQGTIKKVDDKTIISYWIRPNFIFIILTIAYLLILLFVLFSFDEKPKLLLGIIGILIFGYCSFLLEVSTHKKTILKLFKIN